MSVVKVLGVLLLHVALVTPGTQICQDPDEKAYSIITCGAPGKNGLPGINGTNGAKGEKGEPGPPGPKGERGDSAAPAIENFKLQMAGMDRRIRDLQSNLEKQEKVLSFKKEFARSGNKFYIINGVEATYSDARSSCANGGGQLAVPQTPEENQVILSLRKQVNRHTFMGINDLQKEGEFRDLSGEAIKYFNWREGEPNNRRGNEHCVEMWDDGRWNDENCSSKRFFVCEF